MRKYSIWFLSPLVSSKEENTFFCKNKHRWLCPQKIYKLRQTKLSQFVYFSLFFREQEETKTKYSAPKWPLKDQFKLEISYVLVLRKQTDV
jgi:hypothetical protein